MRYESKARVTHRPTANDEATILGLIDEASAHHPVNAMDADGAQARHGHAPDAALPANRRQRRRRRVRRYQRF